MDPGRRRLISFAAAGLGLSAAGLAGGAVAFQRDLLYDRGPRCGPLQVKGAAIAPVTLRTADGERLTGWHLPPRDAGQPVLLFLNGRVGGLPLQRGRWRRIAARGAGFLAVDYRGYGGSTGHPSERGLVLDARAAHAFLARRYPASRIVIHGYSLGSAVAVRLAAIRPARALVLEAPFTSLGAVVDARAAGLPLDGLLADRYRSADWIGRVRMPLLIVHGDKDSVVPFAEGRRLFGLAHEPKAFAAIRDGDHNTLVRDGLYDRVWAFLDRLPPRAATA